MDNDRQRVDTAMVARGLAASRERAQAMIAAGHVLLNGTAVAKPATKVAPEDRLEIVGETLRYVSRGGLKLEKALKVFAVDVSELICADIGASTGGFTDVLLQGGAAKVYAVDVGTAQLDPKLLGDPRVVNLEHVNARALEASMFDTRPSLAVMDVSFISIRLILPALFNVLGNSGRLVSLVKPQFEAGRQAVGKRGIVSSPKAHAEVLRNIASFAPTLGWQVQGLDFSPITGGDGNIEFLADLVPTERCRRVITEDDILSVVKRAHAEME